MRKSSLISVFMILLAVGIAIGPAVVQASSSYGVYYANADRDGYVYASYQKAHYPYYYNYNPVPYYYPLNYRYYGAYYASYRNPPQVYPYAYSASPNPTPYYAAYLPNDPGYYSHASNDGMPVSKCAGYGCYVG